MCFATQGLMSIVASKLSSICHKVRARRRLDPIVSQSKMNQIEPFFSHINVSHGEIYTFPFLFHWAKVGTRHLVDFVPEFYGMDRH